MKCARPRRNKQKRLSRNTISTHFTRFLAFLFVLCLPVDRFSFFWSYIVSLGRFAMVCLIWCLTRRSPTNQFIFHISLILFEKMLNSQNYVILFLEKIKANFAPVYIKIILCSYEHARSCTIVHLKNVNVLKYSRQEKQVN